MGTLMPAETSSPKHVLIHYTNSRWIFLSALHDMKFLEDNFNKYHKNKFIRKVNMIGIQ